MVTPMAQKGVGEEGNHCSMIAMGPKNYIPSIPARKENIWIRVDKRKYSIRMKRITLKPNCLV